jgi:chemotaxis protein MotB
MPREEEPKGGAPEWMCTFSDMMSLLLCFFVLLFSLSTIEKKKLIQASGSLRKAFGGLPAPYITEDIPDKHTKKELSQPAQLERRKFFGREELLREEQKKVKSKNLQKVIQVTGTEQGITFRVSGDALFETGSYEIKEDAYVALQFIADELILYASNPVRIEGNTDPSRTRSDPNGNWILAARRAYAVMEYFNTWGSELGQLSPHRLTYESHAEFNPVADNSVAIGQALNRRVDITLLQTDDGFGTYFDDETVKDPRTSLLGVPSG